jgi:hypothetical protein
MHSLRCSPWDCHLFSNFGPHLWFEPTVLLVRILEVWLKHTASLPLVESSEFVLELFVPITSSFEVLLVVLAAADSTPARQTL